MQIKNADFVADPYLTYVVDSSLISNVNATLPDAKAVGNDGSNVFVNIGTIGTVTILPKPGSGQKINGLASYVVTTLNKTGYCITNGTDWWCFP